MLLSVAVEVKILPKERYGDSLSGRGSNTQPSDWEADQPSPPQRNFRRQCLGVRWYYDVPLEHCWETSDRRKRITSSLTIRRDFMQAHQIFRVEAIWTSKISSDFTGQQQNLNGDCNECPWKNFWRWFKKCHYFFCSTSSFWDICMFWLPVT